MTTLPERLKCKVKILLFIIAKKMRDPYQNYYHSLEIRKSKTMILLDILKFFPFGKYYIKYVTIETNNDKEKEIENL